MVFSLATVAAVVVAAVAVVAQAVATVIVVVATVAIVATWAWDETPAVVSEAPQSAWLVLGQPWRKRENQSEKYIYF